MRLLTFGLDAQHYALPLDAVDRVVRSVAITSLPKAPPGIQGVIDVEGRIIPVADTRGRFRLPARAMTTLDQMIIARTRRRTLALLVDRVGGVAECPVDGMTAAQKILPELPYIAGVVTLADGTILIQDLDSFLSLDEEEALTAALGSRPEEQHGH